ncbi:peptide-methionine (S)-S-oxide reductase MsrA [Roseivirga sp. E12]|uniref:peptide-methionine (S)-S-oxide reductase MsrA n=1 Tax=Roseivirga sp. E12 TaxID=2819237 RepID=UPI001ABCCD6C|nr:peptide-methionine (S)-S-oxide reductase MsrA [Roseivirga sp. E12]MBO3697126.1 peptide-methionine (S)-S-oxide reductase MsrA [Roseivirga sp. E12]
MQGLYSVLISIVFNLSVSSCAQEAQTKLALPSDLQDGDGIATFAGGCFWCTEAVFERVKGVKDVYSGYTGGKEDNPTYSQVSYGRTTHAEAIQIIYDPNVISYQELLDIFFISHYPTQVNGQGPDRGAQYRAVVFYHNSEQKNAAESIIRSLEESGKFSEKIATTVEAYDKFWMAEDYHQDYYELNPGNPYIIQVAIPKVKKLKKYFPQKIKDKYKAEK